MVSQQPTPWLGEFDSTMIWCNSHGADARAAQTLTGMIFINGVLP